MQNQSYIKVKVVPFVYFLTKRQMQVFNKVKVSWSLAKDWVGNGDVRLLAGIKLRTELKMEYGVWRIERVKGH